MYNDDVYSDDTEIYIEEGWKDILDLLASDDEPTLPPLLPVKWETTAKNHQMIAVDPIKKTAYKVNEKK